MEFTPPYIHQGLYSLEARKLIEASNASTVAAIFERRRREREHRAWLAKIKAMHDGGIHMPGSCPFCPANYYYD